MYASSSRTPQSASTLPNPRKHPPPKQTSIGYPILPTQELVDCLQELGANVSEEDLKRPTAPMVRNIWSAVLHYFTGVSKAGLERPKGAMLSMVTYPELYSDALHLQMFFIHVKRLVKTAGVETFTLQDLTRPEHARVCDCFSAVINFAKFKLSHSGLYEELVARGDEINQRRAELAEEAARISFQLQQLKDKQESNKPLITAAHERNEILFRELGELKKQQKLLTDRYVETEREREAKKKEHHELQKSTNSLSANISAERSRLVRSPERIRRTIGELSTNTAREKEDLGSALKSFRDLGARLELIVQGEQDMRGVIELMQQAEVLGEEIEDRAAQKEGLDARLRATEIERQSGETRLEQLATQLANATDKLSRARESWAERKERFNLSIARLRDDYEVIKRERDEDDATQRKREKEIARLTLENEDFIARNQAEVNALMEEYWKLRAHCESYMSEMRLKLALE